MRRLVLAASLLALAGCDASDADGDLRLLTDATAYAPGASVTLSLLNDGGAEVYAHPSLCGAFTQQRTPAGWVGGPPLILCTGEVARVGPSGALVTDYALPTLEPGTYRFVYEVRGERVASDPFEVVE